MTDPKSQSDPRDQEQAIERRPESQDPTAVDHTRESDASTITSSGLTGGRPDGPARVTPERARTTGAQDTPDTRDDEPLTRVDI